MRGKRLVTGFVIVGAPAVAGAIAWRRNPRLGSGLVNAVVNPRLLKSGLVGGGSSELGLIEHIGRHSGVRRLTPIHPEVTDDGFRILVPLGPSSEWARNVLAAGHCRLQVHDTVHELDDPRLVEAGDVPGLPAAVRGAFGALGFEYLLLRRVAAAPGSLTEERAADRDILVAAGA